MEGSAYREQTRMPRDIQRAREAKQAESLREDEYEYREVQTEEPALKGAYNPNGPAAQRAKGWEICETDPAVTGHELKVIMRKPKHRHLADTAPQRAKSERPRPNQTMTIGTDIREGITVYEGALSLSDISGLDVDDRGDIVERDGGQVSMENSVEGAYDTHADDSKLRNAVEAAAESVDLVMSLP